MFFGFWCGFGRARGDGGAEGKRTAGKFTARLCVRVATLRLISGNSNGTAGGGSRFPAATTLSPRPKHLSRTERAAGGGSRFHAVTTVTPRQTSKKAPTGVRAFLLYHAAKAASAYLEIDATAPAPTVRPPSRIAKRVPSSIAIGAISSTETVMLSPGITISLPSGRLMIPVTSVVRK